MKINLELKLDKKEIFEEILNYYGECEVLVPEEKLEQIIQEEVTTFIKNIIDNYTYSDDMYKVITDNLIEEKIIKGIE